MMKNFFGVQCIVITMLFIVSTGASYNPPQKVGCANSRSKCSAKSVNCPVECPSVQPTDPNAKACYIDCNSPTCEAICITRKPNCNGSGAACLDPSFTGGDGIVFYFHGRSNEHFSLISDPNLQINARFIGLRHEGKTREYTWIQALGMMFDSHTFSVEARKVAKWDNEVDQLEFSYDGKTLVIPEIHLPGWKSPEQDLIVERTSNKNSVKITLTDFVEISINIVPVTKEDNKVHDYQLPSNDCFAHLEVQFRFFGLSPDVEGVLGRTYRPDFKNPVKPGVAVAVVGAEDKYRTKTLLSSDCNSCVFSPAGVIENDNPLLMDYGTLDCSRGANGGNGIVCKK
ncbi:hypothetical protein MKX03_016415 [Papaver bracteatum]|nr:hypothetical protein MKX03_016415 [Papaver bracteatum]